jgi:NTE family protein
MSKEVSLVLSSGGARGCAHIGIIEVLEEEGFTIKSIAGSSMGAVVGGIHAAGKLPEYKEWIMHLDRMEVFKLLDFTFSTQGFIRGDRVFNEMKKFIADCKIENLHIPFAAVAVDVVNRKEVVFTRGSLYTALRASASIPSVLKPSLIDGVELVDGGVLNPIPIAHVPQRADLLVVADVNASIPYQMPEGFGPKAKKKGADNGYLHQLEQWKGKIMEMMPDKFWAEKEKPSKRLSYFDMVNLSVNLMQDRISDFIIERHQPDILVNFSRDACATFEFYRAAELIAAGRQQAKKAIKEWNRKS